MENHDLTRLSPAQIKARLDGHVAYRRGLPRGLRARFDYCDLSGAQFLGADLVDADFTGARLELVDLTGAQLSGANFFGADLRRAKLMRCDLRRADLRGALALGVDLSDSDLSNADLREGIIARRARKGELIALQHQPSSAALSGINQQSTLDSQSASGALTGVAADFSYSNMKNVKLVRAHLKQAIMLGCDLTGADMSGANIEGADLRGAIMIGTTTLMMNTRGADMRDIVKAATHQNPTEALRISSTLESHILWYESEGTLGALASFDGLDMRGCGRLAGRVLAGLRARDACFAGLDLTDAQLQGAVLAGADFRGADLSGADLRGANLTGAKFQRARLVGCKMSPLIASGSRQFPCDLTRADLSAADLTGADLFGARMQGAVLTGSISTSGVVLHRMADKNKYA